jgi:copper resistance protein B
MHIKSLLTIPLLALAFIQPVWADDMAENMDEHGGGVFHMFRLEGDYGGGTGNGVRGNWDFQGWVGGDDNKLWLQSEGKHADGKLEDANVWALYSRNISTFWDAQAGIRHDVKPSTTDYLVLGFNGLAPYLFETQAHLFISDRGGVTARLREENDFLVTQQLILQPYGEINLSGVTVPKQDVGTGVTEAKIGLQTRYEFTRKFAPYIDLHYAHYIGNTMSVTKDDSETSDGLVAAVGLRLMF